VTTHHFTPARYFNTLGSHPPALHIQPGDTIVTTTVDAGGYDSNGEQVTEGGNPQTGPFFVEGAEPGDALAVRLERIVPNRKSGWTRSTLAAGVVDPEYVPELGDNPRIEWEVDTTSGTARPLVSDGRLQSLSVSLAPMLGCFGVAPPGGQAISSATSGEHGGNMDYNGFVEGATVYFPVFVPGALLTIGDCHAAQGDGEIAGTGIEISADVQFTVALQKTRAIGWPRGEKADYIFSVGNARPLDEALQHATTEMMRWLTADYRFDVQEAGTLLGQCVEYDVGNVFDPAYTVACKLGKRYLP
jgi:amidase